MSSARLAALVVDELIRLGVREVVLCPGSRSAPLAYAVGHAEAAGRLRLHVRVDERSAGFLALGLAAASGNPVAVVTTSGTAAANLHPAVLEASHRGLPLLALTADRPPELTGTGANQTTEQTRLFGGATRWFLGLDAATPEVARAAIDRAVGWATGALSRDPGPIQINLAFREPLVATPLDVEIAGEGPLTSLGVVDVLGSVAGPEPVPSTLIVAGGSPGPWTAYAALAAQRWGWPVIAEASAGFGQIGLPHGALLLEATEWLERHVPERVIVVGNPTLHRSVQRLLGRDDVEVVVVAATPRWPDAARTARRVVAPGWLRAVAELASMSDTDAARTAPAWTTAADIAAAVVERTLAWPSGAAVTRTLAAALPPQATLQVGSSNPVRDLDLAATPRPGLTVLANRGLSGIDGTLSTAVGLALALDRPSYALLGDLAFLHDLNGLLIGPAEPKPDLTVVVCNDDGGGIFATLEQGAPGAPPGLERLFATPTGARLEQLATGVGARYLQATTSGQLGAAVARPPVGVTVVEVATSRADRRAETNALRAAVAAALTGQLCGQ